MPYGGSPFTLHRSCMIFNRFFIREGEALLVRIIGQQPDPLVDATSHDLFALEAFFHFIAEEFAIHAPAAKLVGLVPVMIGLEQRSSSHPGLWLHDATFLDEQQQFILFIAVLVL